MKIYHLLLIASFIMLMPHPGLAPDPPDDPESCSRNRGFCYRGAECPWCFLQYGVCNFHDSQVLCCLREWDSECEEVTLPVDANSPKPTEPLGPQTDPPEKTHQGDKCQ
ncbi:hypothetical protein JRQ81_005273 [Phrynocephalus forsythii]|uniref:Uncharacterized protein n=1 Tax=Phrynocephalus forsythii TaxID=171643 RepID=A0A9Q0Y660_9SAUR|nr:hypothetical protein JRQ81_005273 [Phrynocephalus forsythii]